ncbi:sensor domain-containing diguanylate cyclase [Ureibacillus terrenus]|uniref:sensor domain-containing diguanylate cyclase n=1 Tax=Ureibacillus terrenus TaxID=118246 RepID=UPI002E1D8E27|nr:sensor domain-containing diguanylate cyclase [Ureibacillus terrenus]
MGLQDLNIISQTSIRKFRTILENSNDVVYMYQLKPERKYLYINSAIEREIGYAREEFYKDPQLPFKIVHPDDFQVQIRKITGTSGYNKPFQARFVHKNGYYIWCEDRVIPFYDENGELEKIEGFSRDITEVKALEKKLEELSYYDSLTKLFNRNYYEKIEEKLNTAEDRPIGIIVCDLDNLKIVNDSLGHTCGDQLLIVLGNLLKNLLGGETIVRYGGDEFVILIKNTKENDVKAIYHQIRKEIENYNKHYPHLPIELSMGWSFSPTSIGVMKETFKAADQMMYNEKFNKKRNSMFHDGLAEQKNQQPQ